MKSVIFSVAFCLFIVCVYVCAQQHPLGRNNSTSFLVPFSGLSFHLLLLLSGGLRIIAGMLPLYCALIFSRLRRVHFLCLGQDGRGVRSPVGEVEGGRTFRGRGRGKGDHRRLPGFPAVISILERRRCSCCCYCCCRCCCICICSCSCCSVVVCCQVEVVVVVVVAAAVVVVDD